MSKMKILGPANPKVEYGARKYAAVIKAASWVTEIAIPVYWRECPRIGVIPEIAFIQMIKETDAGKFTGIVPKTYYNPCGLKIANPIHGGKADFYIFPNYNVGCLAHSHHLGLYAKAPGFPLMDTPDPRHFKYLLGAARTVEDLGFLWAENEAYGDEIIEGVLRVRELMSK